METSTSQVGRSKGSSQESLTVSSLVSSLSMEELRSFYRVDNISLKLSDEPTSSTIGQADNVVFFTREQFAARLHFPVSSLTILARHLGPSRAYSSECFLDFSGL